MPRNAESATQVQTPATPLNFLHTLYFLFFLERHGVRGNPEILVLFNMSMAAMRHEIETNHAPLKGDVTVLDTLLTKIPNFRLVLVFSYF